MSEEAPEREADRASGDAALHERLVDSRVLHRGRYLTFRVDRVQRADGSHATRDVCGHPGAVAVLALDDEDNILLVRQYRHPAGQVLLEIPAGTLDPAPDGDGVEDHAAAARRELEEETGYRAESWELLTSFWTAPGFATELMHLYLARGLRRAEDAGDGDGDRRGPDEDERLHVVSLPWRVALAMAEAGEIHDAKTLVGLLWLSRLRDRIESEGATRAEAETQATDLPEIPQAEIPPLETPGRLS